MVRFLSPDSGSGLDMQTNMLGIAPSRAHRSLTRPPRNWTPGRWGRSWRPTDCRCPAVSVDLHDSALCSPPSSCTLLLFGVSLGLLFLATVLFE
ncbi:hypothetical protein K466DRAFT_299504 [Polyporus arcularius HHB13444]|uniref:Uncharacterized protein n=1 Tax=Polyporus arcularius HHB13444 TaxID=1314778 RepID=A0A5C3NYI9_9APHY|nr:hypothetical protein K466DRAFT_299504 [Polyporus arcularius HHB13444]